MLKDCPLVPYTRLVVQLWLQFVRPTRRETPSPDALAYVAGCHPIVKPCPFWREQPPIHTARLSSKWNMWLHNAKSFAAVFLGDLTQVNANFALLGPVKETARAGF